MELEHTKIYTEIETLRFPEISVTYHIDSEDFFVPALTVQPLVENAIRHGVRELERGEVVIETRQTDNAYIITISDNGVGFDTEKLLPADEMHMGIGNVGERVRAMCGGRLTIDSRQGAGTVATITIPRETE